MQEWHEGFFLFSGPKDKWTAAMIEAMAAKGIIQASKPIDPSKSVEGFLTRTLGAKLTDVTWVWGLKVENGTVRPGQYTLWVATSVEAFSAHRKLMRRGTLAPYDANNVQPWIASIRYARAACWYQFYLSQRSQMTHCEGCWQARVYDKRTKEETWHDGLRPAFINFYVTDNKYECWMVPQLPTTMLVYKQGAFNGFKYCITEFVGLVSGIVTTPQPDTVTSTWFKHAECRQVKSAKLQMYTEPCAAAKFAMPGGQMVKGDTFRYGGVMLKRSRYPAAPCGLSSNPFDWVFVMRDADGVSGWLQAGLSGYPSLSVAYVSCCAAPNVCTQRL